MMEYGDISSVFKTLTTWERINLLCDIFRTCNPIELRFYATFIEDLAKRDYNYLRERENEANDPETFNKFDDALDENTLSHFNLYLALLHSYAVPACADNVAKSLLSIKPKLWNLYSAAVKSLSPKPWINQEFADDVILVLTLGSQHPAMWFHHRQELTESLAEVVKLLNNLLGKEDTLSLSNDSEVTF